MVSRRLKVAVALLLAVTLVNISFYLNSTKPTISIVGTIPVGADPRAVAVNAITHRVYVTNLATNDVSVIDTVANTSVATVQVGKNPYLIAVNQETNVIYVQTDDGLDVINGTNSRHVKTLPISGRQALRVDPTLNRLYVVTWENGGMLYVIDGSTNSIVDTIDLKKQYNFSGPCGLDIDPQAHQIYITEVYGGGLLVINSTNLRLITGVPYVGNVKIIVDRKPNRIYALYGYPNHQSYGLNILDATTYKLIAGIRTDGSLLAFDPTRSLVYMIDFGNNTLITIDGQSGRIMGSLQLAFQPKGIDVDISTGRIFVTDPKASSLVIIQVQK